MSSKSDIAHQKHPTKEQYPKKQGKGKKGARTPSPVLRHIPHARPKEAKGKAFLSLYL